MFYQINERYGRRKALHATGWVFKYWGHHTDSCGEDMPSFYVVRVVNGLGIGGLTFVVPQYIPECAPASARGSIVGCVSLFV